MSLPAAWVDRVFEKLTLVYGRDFIGRWEGTDLNAVKSDWGHELAGFEKFPKSIAWALQNLPPEKAPTVLQFRAIARRAPDEAPPRIEPSIAGKERIAEELRKLGPILAKTAPSGDSLDWARRLIQRHESGAYKSTRAALAMARDALGLDKPGASA